MKELKRNLIKKKSNNLLDKRYFTRTDLFYPQNSLSGGLVSSLPEAAFTTVNAESQKQRFTYSNNVCK